MRISVGRADFTGDRPLDERGDAFDVPDLATLASWLNTWAHPAGTANAGGYWCPFELRAKGHVIPWTALVLDYDGGAPPPELAAYDRVTHETRSSTSHAPRWRVIVAITRPVLPSEVKRLVRFYSGDRGATGHARLFWGRLATSTATHIPGAPLDPDALLPLLPADPEPADADWTDGPQAGATPIVDDAELIARASRTRSARSTFGGGAGFAELWAGDADALGRAFPSKTQGDAYDGSAADLALCNALMFWTGNDCERTARMLQASGLARPKHERTDYVRSTVLRARQPAVYSVAPVVPPVAAVVALASGVTFDRQGRVEATLANVAHMLRTDQAGNIRYDAFTDQTIVAGEPLTDELVSRLRITLERQRVAPPSKETMRDALEYVGRENVYDSAQDWLGSLAWDGVPRIDTFFVAYGGAEDTPYVRSVGAYMFTALAGRVLSPGCKADMVPVFIGAQGVGRKTSTVAALAPSPDRFVDIDLRERDADLSRRMRGKLVAELSELRGLAKRDLESLKSFITRTHEGWIPKYREFEITYPRRLVFIGTTNHEQFLEDETGNRRWLPVHVRAFDRDAVERDRNQLWAEGAARYRQSGIAWQGAEALAAPIHAAHMVHDSWEQKVEIFAAKQTGPFAIGDALGEGVGLHASQWSKAAELRMARTLKALGWASKVVRVNGRLTRRWFKD